MKKIYTVFLFTIALSFSHPVKSQVLDTVLGFINWQSPATTADLGITGNINTSTISSPGAVNFFVSDGDGTGQRAIADGWANGANSRAWKTSFSTLKYGQLKYSCKMDGSNPSFFLGPRDFKLQYSLNGSTWTDVSGGTIQASSGQTIPNFASLNNVVLPAACENQLIVYVRMLQTSNIAVTGGTVNTGQSHIDDIKVTGYSIPEAPSDITLSNKSFLLSTSVATVPSGTLLGTMASVDFNKGNSFTYSLVSGTGSTHNSLFTLSGTTITTASSLGAGTYSIRIRSTDNSTLFYEKVLSILVTAPDPLVDGTRSQLSAMGTILGTTAYTANAPAQTTYNSTNNEYLTVWQGDDDHAPLVDNEFEIFGQRINAGTGVKAGNMIRISFMGPNGSPTHRAINPSVVYNATNNEYFVVWQGYHNIGSLAATEDEIWGQRINAATGVLIGSVVRVSAMGTDGVASSSAQTPDVSWNSVNNQYLVVWRGDEVAGGLVDNEYEVYGQLVNNLGALSGTRTRISVMGPNGTTLYNAFTPAVSYDATDNKYLVVWRGDDNSTGLVDNDYEVFGQMVTNTISPLGPRLQISTMGTIGVPAFGTLAPPDVTWNTVANEFFVVWSADDNTGALVDNETEIYGQIVTNTGSLSGSRIRLSDMGPDGVTTFAASNPKVAFIASLNEYWVVWHGDDDATSVDNENEIFLQRVLRQATEGVINGRVTEPVTEVGNNDIRISYLGSTNNADYDASQPAITYNTLNGKAYIVWQGDDNTAPLVDNAFQVWGQSVYEDEALPVTWLSFTGELQAKHVLLNWQTASEWNSKEFVIQRSATAVSWDSIGIQLASKNSNAVQNYSFTDFNPVNGNCFYRLLQKDQDGKYGYSKVIFIRNQAQVKFAVFPNPVSQYLTLQLPVTGRSMVRIFDNSGHLLRKQQFNDMNIVVDLQGITPGIYSVQVTQDKDVYTKKFVKK